MNLHSIWVHPVIKGFGKLFVFAWPYVRAWALKQAFNFALGLYQSSFVKADFTVDGRLHIMSPRTVKDTWMKYLMLCSSQGFPRVDFVTFIKMMKSGTVMKFENKGRTMTIQCYASFRK